MTELIWYVWCTNITNIYRQIHMLYVSPRHLVYSSHKVSFPVLPVLWTRFRKSDKNIPEICFFPEIDYNATYERIRSISPRPPHTSEYAETDPDRHIQANMQNQPQTATYKRIRRISVHVFTCIYIYIYIYEHYTGEKTQSEWWPVSLWMSQSLVSLPGSPSKSKKHRGTKR